MEPTNRTPAGDQYSLGCTLYYCLTGRYPFAEGNAVEKMMAHQFKEPTPLKELAPDTPDELCKAVERLMKKSPDERYRGTDEFAEELAPLAGELPPAAPLAATPATRTRRSSVPPPPSPLSAPPAFPSAKLSQTGRSAPRLSDIPKPADRKSQSPEFARRNSMPPAAPASAYPAPAAYPHPASPARGSSPYAQPAAYAAAGALPPPSSSANLQLQMPTRESLRGGNGEPAYAMPPGFIEPDAPRQFGPLLYAAVGMGVMIVAYLGLTALNPFR
jgi:serine/threonine-protein kinase